MRIYITGVEEAIRKVARAKELIKELDSTLRGLYVFEEIQAAIPECKEDDGEKKE